MLKSEDSLFFFLFFGLKLQIFEDSCYITPQFTYPSLINFFPYDSSSSMSFVVSYYAIRIYSTYSFLLVG